MEIHAKIIKALTQTIQTCEQKNITCEEFSIALDKLHGFIA